MNQNQRNPRTDRAEPCPIIDLARETDDSMDADCKLEDDPIYCVCGSTEDSWFSRTFPMGYFCPDCGKER